MMGRAPSMPVSNTKPERRLQDALRLLDVPVWECSPRDILRGALSAILRRGTGNKGPDAMRVDCLRAALSAR